MLRFAVAAGLACLGGLALLHATLGVDPTVVASAVPCCPLRFVFDLPCPGCGMTRALLLLAALRVGDSFAMHPAALPTVLAATLWLVRADWLRRVASPGVVSAALVALLALWASRLPLG